MSVHETACPLDCPDACSLLVETEADRLIRLAGTSRNPLTAGFLCSKVRNFDRRLKSPQRLLQPALRTGEKGGASFRPCTWAEALDLVSERLGDLRSRYGGESILPFFYGGSNGLVSQGAADRIFFEGLGALRLARTLCAAATTRAATGLYGAMPGVSPEDYRHADLIVIWGANPSASGIHHVPPILEALRRGARLVVVDPVRTPLAAKASLHIALRPGTDLPIALSLIRWLFDSGQADSDFLAQHALGVERLREQSLPWTFQRASEVAGVSPSLLEEFAKIYQSSQPAVVRCGWGLERNRNGGSAVAAVLALPAVAGKFGVRGGGYTMSNSGAWQFNVPTWPSTGSPRTVNMNRLGRELLETEPRIRALFVYNCNPAATLPNQQAVLKGLAREDLFTVVFDQVMTDTARFADVVLPATTFLEHEDLARGYGAMVLHRVKPVLTPEGEARSNFDVFRDLAARLGVLPADFPSTAGAWADQIVRRSGLDPERLDRDGYLFPSSGFTPIQFVDVQPRTPSGKIELAPLELDAEAPFGLYSYQGDPGDEEFPLALISPATSGRTSSTFGEVYAEQVPLRMNPMDASVRGLLDKDEVEVFNTWGVVRCRLKIDETSRPGVVVLPKGLWSHNTLNGATSNSLSPDTATDLGAGACFNDSRVEVRAAS